MLTRPLHFTLLAGLLPLAAASLLLPAAALAQVGPRAPSVAVPQPQGPYAPEKPAPPAAPGSPQAGPAGALNPHAKIPPGARAILATVNGDVVTTGDLNARRRLFAVSAGLPMSEDVLDRLSPQVLRQLIDEKLRLQEIQRRKIVVSDKDIADSIAEIEKRNNMPPGGLRQKLGAQGINMRTLIDQIRVQLGWGQVLRQQLGDNFTVKDSDIAEQESLFKAQVGQTEYRVAEIFIPVDEPAHSEDARKFADVVAGELRKGAPFGVVAAQFSQSQTALQGGDLGWVEPNQVDPAIASIIKEMPPGAISNPIKVAGGFSIVTLHGKREIGRDEGTELKLRQAFFPFTSALDPSAPTDAQRAQLEKARALSANAHSCDAIEEANKANGGVRPTDPGDLRLDQLANPQLRALLTGLPDGKASQPLVGNEGIAVIMICSREQRNFGMPSKQEISSRVLNDRVELASRQLQRSLRRHAMIEQKTDIAG